MHHDGTQSSTTLYNVISYHQIPQLEGMIYIYIMPKIESYQLNNGLTRYRFQLHAGRSPLTGKRLVTRRSGFRSRRAAQVELTRLQSQLERNGTINSVTPVSRKRTFKNVYEE